jgi:hypothetical protein
MENHTVSGLDVEIASEQFGVSTKSLLVKQLIATGSPKRPSEDFHEGNVLGGDNSLCLHPSEF